MEHEPISQQLVEKEPEENKQLVLTKATKIRPIKTLTDIYPIVIASATSMLSLGLTSIIGTAGTYETLGLMLLSGTVGLFSSGFFLKKEIEFGSNFINFLKEEYQEINFPYLNSYALYKKYKASYKNLSTEIFEVETYRINQIEFIHIIFNTTEISGTKQTTVQVKQSLYSKDSKIDERVKRELDSLSDTIQKMQNNDDSQIEKTLSAVKQCIKLLGKTSDEKTILEIIDVVKDLNACLKSIINKPKTVVVKKPQVNRTEIDKIKVIVESLQSNETKTALDLI